MVCKAPPADLTSFGPHRSMNTGWSGRDKRDVVVLGTGLLIAFGIELSVHDNSFLLSFTSNCLAISNWVVCRCDNHSCVLCLSLCCSSLLSFLVSQLIPAARRVVHVPRSAAAAYVGRGELSGLRRGGVRARLDGRPPKTSRGYLFIARALICFVRAALRARIFYGGPPTTSRGYLLVWRSCLVFARCSFFLLFSALQCSSRVHLWM